jgi:hypothetical protein
MYGGEPIHCVQLLCLLRVFNKPDDSWRSFTFSCGVDTHTQTHTHTHTHTMLQTCSSPANSRHRSPSHNRRAVRRGSDVCCRSSDRNRSLIYITGTIFYPHQLPPITVRTCRRPASAFARCISVRLRNIPYKWRRLVRAKNDRSQPGNYSAYHKPCRGIREFKSKRTSMDTIKPTP